VSAPLRIQIVADGAADIARAEALVNACGIARASGPPWDVRVAVYPADPTGFEVPVVLLADELTEEVALDAHGRNARPCLFRHGPLPVRAAILSAANQAAARALVNLSVSDVVFHIRVEEAGFRFTSVNPAFTQATGLAAAAVVGHLVEDVIPEPSRSLAIGHYREAIAEQRTVRWEEVTQYPTGTKIGQVSVTPIVDGAGRCTNLIGTVHDVSDERRLEQQMRELSAHVEAAREEERTGIAREIHDQLGQSLTVLKLEVAWLARRVSDDLRGRADQVLGLIDKLIDEVRRISAELRPGILDDIGLVAALTWQASELERRSGIRCVVRSEISDDEPIPRELATTVFRITQEALTNVVRHASATRVDIRLEHDDGVLALEILDDGAGISDDAIRDAGSLGLLGMRERARRLGGTLTLARVAPHGTAVRVRLPAPAG
jgi:PAS domain S-box-containing protein